MKLIPLFTWTGHPFTDAGLVALLLLNDKEKPEELTAEDIKRAVKFASELYARKEWSSGYIHAMMMPNSGILMANPSMAKKRTPEAVENSLLSLLNEPEDENAPICEVCGRRHAREKPVYRSDFPLVGTGGIPNYFPSGKDGANICSHCVFLTQLMPLVAYRLSRILIIHAYPYEFMVELHRDAFDDVVKTQLASNAKNFRRPENFFFHLISDLMRKIEHSELWKNTSVTLYYFVNNNQGQELDVIHIPNQILRFVAYASLVDSSGWKRIVSMGWRKRPSDEEFAEYERRYSNEVYSRLINGQSILRYFIDKTSREVNSKWELLQFYCSEVLGLDEKALEFVKDVGDRVVETLEKLPDNKLKRRVRELENATKLYQFEAFFVGLEKLRQELNIEKPLMTFDEFARILTSYGEDFNVSWKSVKNLLLFRIYEKLHGRLIREEEIGEEETEEVEIYGFGGEEA
ncbi:MAG: CRISPR-associated protein Cst1 [Thermococcales archaeon 44_46]|nr:MAG: CRISPR-associated protein Cst1 [Thermococcales archaeon 44_46]MDK2782934.1 CRISPR-associated protein Cst1 [Thermococcaceae archaeon]MDK2982636.1 CRISPR-associated protein Cst1 [Thermococcaceae archaeon]